MTILRTVRKKRGVTAKSVADAVGINHSYYCKLENGKAGASADVAARLTVHFGGDVTEMQILYPERYETDLPELKAGQRAL